MFQRQFQQLKLPTFMNRHSCFLILLAGYVTFFTSGPAAAQGENDERRALAVTQDPETLSAPPAGTDVVPHLGAPIVPGRNVVYSAGFQLVWNAMWDRFTKEAPKLEPASELATSLNLRGIEAADIAPESVFIKCGYHHEGVVDQVRREMAERFPGSPFPITAPEPDDSGLPRIFIYAHLEKTLAFENPFMPVSKAGFQFVPENRSAARIRTVAVRGFGLEPLPHPAAEQVKIHYFSRDKGGNRSNHHYVVELKTRSADTELLLARVPPGPTMQSTIEEVGRLRRGMPRERAMAQAEMKRLNSLPKEESERISYQVMQQAEQRLFDSNPDLFSSYDSLIVPVIDFQLRRVYDELAGRKVLNHGGGAGPAMITRASQTLRFRLDEKGVELRDDSEMEEEENGVAGRHLNFCRPFLLLLNERKSGKTVFAAWIGNAELLEAVP